jgi:hypothetical protein
MNALAFDGDDLAVDAALVALPINDSGLSKVTSIKINMDRHGEAKIANADIHTPIPDLVVRRDFNKCRQSGHSSSPRFHATERFDSSLHRLGFGNPVTALSAANHFDFRQTVAGGAV